MNSINQSVRLKFQPIIENEREFNDVATTKISNNSITECDSRFILDLL